MNIESIIKRNSYMFRGVDLEICQYILAHKKEIGRMSITDLANESFTSKSSVLRFVQKLGFSGYSEFKYIVDWEENEMHHKKDFLIKDISKNLEVLLSKIEKMDLEPLFNKFLSPISHTYLVSTGLNQQYQAQDLQRNFLGLGVHMSLLPSGAHTELSSRISEKLTSTDILIVFSHSGENEYVKTLLAIPIINNVPIVSITGSGHNWLKDQSFFNISLETDTLNHITDRFYSGFCHVAIDYITLAYENYLRETLLREL